MSNEYQFVVKQTHLITRKDLKEIFWCHTHWITPDNYHWRSLRTAKVHIKKNIGVMMVQVCVPCPAEYVTMNFTVENND